MPNDGTLDDIGYERYVIESVQKGLDELDCGDYLTHEQAKERFRRAQRREDVRRFAMELAGTELDLDQELESAALEDLDRFYEDEQSNAV